MHGTESSAMEGCIGIQNNEMNNHMQIPSPGQFDSKTNLIVNYLPTTMSQDEMREMFASIGEVTSCKLVRDKLTGQSLCYGFVNFAQPEHAEHAVARLNGLRLHNKTLKVAFARPPGEVPSKDRKETNLYISGLPKTIVQNEFENIFAIYGKIVSSRLFGYKGVGFVQYETKAQAERAIEERNGKALDGSSEPLVVKFANNKNNTIAIPLASYLAVQRRFTTMLNPSTPHAPVRTGLRYSPLTSDNIGKSVNFGTPTSGTGWSIYIFNLAPETEDNVLWQLFGPFGAVQSVRVFRDLQTNKCRGFGFVTMTNYEEAEMAINVLNGYMLQNRKLKVSFKTQSRKTQPT
ncbi:hypothetical protein CHUAL_010090 [Chamberlinius hualienensis]